jgi:hypothetical protein
LESLEISTPSVTQDTHTMAKTIAMDKFCKPVVIFNFFLRKLQLQNFQTKIVQDFFSPMFGRFFSTFSCNLDQAK